MKGKITKHNGFSGALMIARGKFWRAAMCPEQKKTTNCGDWCVKFGEPVEFLDWYESTGTRLDKPFKVITLQICQDRLLRFDEFEDERCT